MKKIIQKLFGTTKQAIISTACIFAVLALAGAIYSKSREIYATPQDTGNTSSAEVDVAAETASESASSPVDGQGMTTTQVTLDEAKEIALTEAGLSSSDVTFKKAKLDKDDGLMVYEIEFYYGRTEYEVKINASTGAIVEYEVDRD